MNCTEFRDNILAFSNRQLEEELRLKCEEHITSCVSCLDLWLSNRTDQFTLESHAGEKLSKSILQTTNANTCEKAEDLLVDFVDEKLSLLDTGLVSAHLENCTTCNQTAMTLMQLKDDLPQLSHQKPPDDLLENILRQTLPWPKLLARKFSLIRLSFSNVIMRPRFSLEASFLSTFLWLALFGIPSNASTWAIAEPSNFEFDVIPTTEVGESLSNLQENLGTDVLDFQPIITRGIKSLGSFSNQLIVNGINKTKIEGNELWQSLTEALPRTLSDSTANE